MSLIICKVVFEHVISRRERDERLIGGGKKSMLHEREGLEVKVRKRTGQSHQGGWHCMRQHLDWYGSAVSQVLRLGHFNLVTGFCEVLVIFGLCFKRFHEGSHLRLYLMALSFHVIFRYYIKVNVSVWYWSVCDWGRSHSALLKWIIWTEIIIKKRFISGSFHGNTSYFHSLLND